VSEHGHVGIKTNGYNLDIKNPHQPEEEKQSSSAELLGMLHQSFANGDELLNKLKLLHNKY